MLFAIFLLLAGLVILVGGAEYLVKGAAALAKKMRIAPLVIGLTVVAFGTSMPELIVNIFSALKGSSGMAIGNVLGSNIANILLILGVTAVIYPLSVRGNTVWREIPFAFVAAIMVLIMGNDKILSGTPDVLSRADGLILLGLFVIFMFYILALTKKTREKPEEIQFLPLWKSIGFTAMGLAALFLGGKLLVDNAIILARLAGLSEALIGLTIVAVGTSLPELVTSIVAAIHHHDDIAVGNIVGSNIFNILWVLGLSSIINPLSFSAGVNLDLSVVIFSTGLLFVFMFIQNRYKLDRSQGATFLLLYALYIFYLIYRG